MEPVAMNRLKTLLLTGKDVQKILPVAKTLEIVESAFRQHGEGKAILPPKLYLTLPRHVGDFRAMPAYLEPPKRCGIKWVNVHPGNRSRDLPTVMALIILNDPETGFPLAVLDGTSITKMRTGAAGAVAAKHLARKEASILGLVGCGAQAEAQLLFLLNIFKFEKIKFWGLTEKEKERFYQNMKGMHAPLEAKKTVRETVLDSDLIVTTTPSRRPIVRREWVKPGAHLNAIGADAKGKEELEIALLKAGKIVVDDWHQASESGEINVPFARGEVTKKEIYGTLGEIVCGFKKGRTHSDEITIFDATGLAIQDIAVAWMIYQRARQDGLGKEIAFF